MASKIFILNESLHRDSNSDIKCNSELTPILTNNKPSKLWLFMIGGSAAGIITPLSRFFISMVSKDVVVPIFIDDKCHSNTTSSAISEIAMYEDYCRMICTKSRISQPFFFVEDSITSLKELGRFRSIVCNINENDEVFVVFSAHSNFSISVVREIAQKVGDQNKKIAISCGLFLPYLTFYTNEDTVDVLNEIKEDQKSYSLKTNLDIINSGFNCIPTKFIIGLSNPSIVKETEYQKNPFNIVQLIMAFASVSMPKQDGGYFNYCVASKGDYLTPNDVIKDTYFRALLITFDFLNLAFKFLMNQKALPTKLMEDRSLLESISSFLHTNSDAIISLGDITVHRNNRMLLRKDIYLNSTYLNKAFRNKTIFGFKPYSVKKLTEELTRHINYNMVFNPNMALHETLSSIKIFIKQNFDKISNLYF